MQIKITLLVDNQCERRDLDAEHGLSLWIEAGDIKILFDTGQTDAFLRNAERMKIPVREADCIVLSHGHYDHTGGISRVLGEARKAVVYCHSGMVLPRYRIANGIARSVQIPRESLEALKKMPYQRLRWISSPLWLNDRIGITGPIPRETDYEDTGGGFYLDPEGKHEDPIEDDLALWIRTGEGMVVCVGCCHAGLVNTLNYVIRLNPGSGIRAVAGGFHLLHADDRRLDQTVASLNAIQPGMLAPCHCTGENAIRFLKNGLSGNVRPCSTGARMAFS